MATAASRDATCELHGLLRADGHVAWLNAARGVVQPRDTFEREERTARLRTLTCTPALRHRRLVP